MTGLVTPIKPESIHDKDHRPNDPKLGSCAVSTIGRHKCSVERWEIEERCEDCSTLHGELPVHLQHGAVLVRVSAISTAIHQ